MRRRAMIALLLALALAGPPPAASELVELSLLDNGRFDEPPSPAEDRRAQLVPWWVTERIYVSFLRPMPVATPSRQSCAKSEAAFA